MTILKKTNALLIVVLTTIVLFSTSCAKEKVAYQTKVRNACEIQLLGLPFMKYNIKELKLGEISYTDINKGDDSEYKTMESDTEYPVSITYDVYYYDADNGIYTYDKTQTEDLGTETWSSTEEGDKFIIKVEIGDILQGYKPLYEVYIAK